MNYSRIIGEAPMGMMNPSEMVSRLDLVVLELAMAGIVFCGLHEGFWNIRVFLEQRVGGGGLRCGHHPSGRAWAPWHALVGGATLGRLSGTSSVHLVSSGPEKFHKKFRFVCTPFDMDFL
jgi:hypothetical protein